jgi:hypothetical protein
VRSFFHNVLFVDFLLAGLYFSILSSENWRHNKFLAWRWSNIREMNWRNLFFAALAGFLIGFSLTVRASEALWLLPVLGLLWLFNIKKCGILKVAVFVVFAALAFLPQVYWNEVLYGGFTRGGYSEMNDSISAIASHSVAAAQSVSRFDISSVLEPLKKIKASIFYFGLNPDKAGDNFNYYFIKMFSWLFWTSVLGLILFLLRFWKHKKKHWVFIISWLLSSFILVLYYGSWRFNDNPDPKEMTIGNSYTRYWLPVYLGAMPFAAFFILRFTWAVFARDEEEGAILVAARRFWDRFFLWRKPGKAFSVAALRAIAVIVLAYVSAAFVFFGSKEGLAFSPLIQDNSLVEYRRVLALTESNSVIITKYHDKVFFPARRVIVAAFDDENLNRIYRGLLDYAPVYYYNFTLPEKDLNYLNDRRLKEAGLGMAPVEKVSSVFTLYRLEKKFPLSQ